MYLGRYSSIITFIRYGAESFQLILVIYIQRTRILQSLNLRVHGIDAGRTRRRPLEAKPRGDRLAQACPH